MTASLVRRPNNRLLRRSYLTPRNDEIQSDGYRENVIASLRSDLIKTQLVFKDQGMPKI